MLSYNQARAEFIKLRNAFEDIVAKTPARRLDNVYAEKFSEVYTNATLGDVVAQDYLGYIFKRGREGLVPENIELSMKWLLLAGANGNPLSLQRLSIFLNYAYDEITRQQDFENITRINRFTSSNFSFEVGKLICEAIVDELKIEPLEIIKEIPTTLEFNSSTMGNYDKARNKIIPVVLTYLRGSNPHQKTSKEEESVEVPTKQTLKKNTSSIFRKNTDTNK